MYFVGIISFISNKRHRQVATNILSTLQERNLRLEKVTQIVSDRGGIKPETTWIQKPLLFPLHQSTHLLCRQQYIQNKQDYVALFIQEKVYAT